MACWLRQRQRRRLPRILRGLISHAAAAANLLRRIDEQITRITQEISHRQMVFQRLLEHYRVPALAGGPRQQLQQLNAQINDSSELWTWLGQLPWEDRWHLFPSHG